MPTTSARASQYIHKKRNMTGTVEHMHCFLAAKYPGKRHGGGRQFALGSAVHEFRFWVGSHATNDFCIDGRYL